MIKNGAELEAKDGLGRTPLLVAVGAFKTADFKYIGKIVFWVFFFKFSNSQKKIRIYFQCDSFF